MRCRDLPPQMILLLLICINIVYGWLNPVSDITRPRCFDSLSLKEYRSPSSLVSQYPAESGLIRPHFSLKPLNQVSLSKSDGNDFNQKDITRLRPEKLSSLDLFDVVRIAFNEFSPLSENDMVATFSLFLDILAVYIPKLCLPESVMGHVVYGLKIPDDYGRNVLVAMADVSLQTASGSTEALDRTSLLYRQRKFSNLAPYLSNFLVVKDFRRLGLGKKLVESIEQELEEKNYNELYLHVDSTSMPAMSFYISLGFEPVKKFSDNLVFMRKVIRI